MNLTLQKMYKSLNAHFTPFDKWIDSIGIVLVNVDDASLKLKGFKMQQSFKSYNFVFDLLIGQYTDNMMKQLFKIIGSVDILGNPNQLYNNLEEGILDFYEKPLEGFIQGPLEGGKGIIKGTGSLVNKTIKGVSTSVSKITDALAGGLSVMTFDTKYIRKR